ncbi:MAG: LAGLIDADG family homing endonuclease, partial [Cyanobacteriota bacterium]|nr:LAGLIDADG family homing endonuclease [Cyanobacteriota bacterium]
MVRELERPQSKTKFPQTAPTANPVFYRTYSRRTSGGQESWKEVCDRTIGGLKKLGKLTDAEANLLYRMQGQLKTLSSGRWLWVGGTKWIEQPENFSGAYNCSSSNVIDWQTFGLLMDLAMMGCGTGAVIKSSYINKLPPIKNRLNVLLEGEIGSTPPDKRREYSETKIEGNKATIYVGDSRQGWVGSYKALLELSTNDRFDGEVEVAINLADVRPAGEPLKGFGGVANPVKLPSLYQCCAGIINKAVGRQLNSLECCLLIDEAAACIVAGNIRRCIAAGTLVSAIDGMKAIEDIKVGDRVLTSSGEYRPTVNKFVQGSQEVVEIRTPAASIRCTANHRVAVYNSLRSYTWKQAGQLQPGDRLISVPHERGAESLNIDYAWVLGFLSNSLVEGSDGVGEQTPSSRKALATYVLPKRLLQNRLGEKCLAILKLMGEMPTISYNSNRGYIRIYRQDSTNPLINSQGATESRQIPKSIWQGTPEIRASFLAGLSDAEGMPARNILLHSNELEFLREVQKLALSLGIATTLSERRARAAKGKKKFKAGEHLIKIQGLQSQAIAFALINQFAVRDRYHIEFANKKKGLSLPYEFIQQVLATTNWQPKPTPVQVSGEGVRTERPPARQKRSAKTGRLKNANFDTLIAEDLVNPHWLPMEVQFVAPAGVAETFDIEVEGDHEFIANGLLVHNSAGMRQGDSNDEIFSVAKDNLWQQGEDGNWRIDPERDALRMSNHTRVFHRKPTLDEVVEAVRKQFYSGEGAIQWAGESVARANRDLLSTPELKRDFIAAYDTGEGKEWLEKRHPEIEPQELEHRLARVGLNPCVTADTWVHTEFGPRQVKDLIGVQHGTFVNGELFSTTEAGFFQTGVQQVLKLETAEGLSVRLTGNHKVLKVTSQTQKRQYTEWVPAEELKPGDRIALHNHREIQPWSGAGNFEEGWLLGNLLGDGSLAKTQWNDIGILRYWGNSQIEMAEYALTTLKSTVAYAPNLAGHYNSQHKLSQISSTGLAKLAAEFGIAGGSKQITPAIEEASYGFYRGFLRGLFDADGSVRGSLQKGVSVRLAQSNLALLEAAQRMLLRLGIASKVYRNRRSEGMRLMPDSNRNKAPYCCKAQHELVIAKDNLAYFKDLIGFREPAKQEQLNALLGNYKRPLYRDRFTATVQALIPDGIKPVYDCTVPGPARFDANGLVVHNCGEIIGSNFHCVKNDTLLITRQGIQKIEDAVGQEIEIWNGKRWSKVRPFGTGTNRQLYRVTFGDGTFLDVTEGHRFFVKDRFGKEYEELTTLDLICSVKWSKYALHTEPFTIDYCDGLFVDPVWAYTLGQLVGDGSVCGSQEKPSLQLRLYGAKSYQQLALAGQTSGKPAYYAENPETPCLLYTGFDRNFDGHQVRDLKANAEPLEAIATWNREAILHFIAGLADADGSAVPSGGIRIYLSGRDRAYRIYLLLQKCGIRSSINLVQTAGTKTNLGERAKDLWYVQVTDCAAIPCQRLDTSGGHEPKAKGKWQVIRSVEPLDGLHDTFCFNEPEFHKGVFGGTLTGQCNLSEIHLNQIDPENYQEQEDAFTAGALSVATLLNHKFVVPRYRESRELDPIVGVSFTGLFDFFVKAFGVDWLRWLAEGRPQTARGLDFIEREAAYLTRWREIVHRVVWDYCDRHGMKRPNRCTTVQPSGTKSLLTNASPGWHPPFGLRWVRRITFAKNDPVALACLDYGYSVVPGQSDKDENGNLLNDPFDDRAKEWLVEIPVEVSWIDLPGVEEIAIESFSATTMFDFYMQVQKHWTTHNTSATILLGEDEVEPLGKRIYEAIKDDEGYISAALLARFDAPFPRLPFER